MMGQTVAAAAAAAVGAGMSCPSCRRGRARAGCGAMTRTGSWPHRRTGQTAESAPVAGTAVSSSAERAVTAYRRRGTSSSKKKASVRTRASSASSGDRSTRRSRDQMTARLGAGSASDRGSRRTLQVALVVAGVEQIPAAAAGGSSQSNRTACSSWNRSRSTAEVVDPKPTTPHCCAKKSNRPRTVA